jgi:hypothetical protein
LREVNTPIAQGIFDAVFREYGLPGAIRTDNGAPFASHGLGGLSRLSIWWLKLGIAPERIEPGHPEQNGRHERMHGTLQQEAASPPAANRREQQRRFDAFLVEYNQERPHEALGQIPPAQIYVPSSRIYTGRAPEVEYPDGMQVRRVAERGQISWQHQGVFVSETPTGEYVGLEAIDHRYYTLYFAHVPLGVFDSREMRVEPRHQGGGGRATAWGGAGNHPPVSRASPSRTPTNRGLGAKV